MAGAFLLFGTGALAQTKLNLPDTSQTTSMSVAVSEQTRISVPAAVSFAVTNISDPTVAAPAAIAIDRIILGTATKQLRVSLRAASSSFTAAAGGSTWAATDVSWNAATWTAALGSGGTLSGSVFGTVASCSPGTAACGTSNLIFSLAPKPAVQRAGSHTLVVTWKVESIGS